MSDQKVVEQSASTGGALGELNAAPVEASVNGPSGAPAPATTQASEPAAANKMESKLEASKAGKPTTKTAKAVAGREKKGTPGDLLKKLMFWKKDKKPEEPPKKEDAKTATQEAVTGATTA
ncbi:hypothetical protein AC579_3847 [Pseudocercospora musae]|uniref:Uncharacterized protein n=1 Tax=Pseudocercospora musae TaxID=113226 RepID=A0A139IRF5_9PEZI|nr:hypothetical protein AC579_3847 [Pseudocercospora musae]